MHETGAFYAVFFSGSAGAPASAAVDTGGARCYNDLRIVCKSLLTDGPGKVSCLRRLRRRTNGFGRKTDLKSLRVSAACLAAVFIMAGFGCAGRGSAGSGPEGGPKIVCTVFAAYDWANQIAEGSPSRPQVKMLFNGGADLHSFQPSVADIVSISECDLFIYVGGDSDAWVDDALADAANPDMRVVNLMDVLKSSGGADLSDDCEGHGVKGTSGHEYDEHVWLSLRNARVFCSEIADALCGVDPAGARVYRANAEKYDAELAALDLKYTETVRSCAKDTVVFADRFPFRYLMRDYGLKYYAAFTGCSAESEVSFGTIAFLARKVDECGLACVMTIEGSDGSIASTVLENTAGGGAGVSVVTMDSMQSAAAGDAARGAGYLHIMEENLKKLEFALN